MSKCPIALVPHLGGQILNTKSMAEELKVVVEIGRDESGWFSKESKEETNGRWIYENGGNRRLRDGLRG